MKLPLILTLCAASPLLGGDGTTVLWHDTPASRFYESAPPKAKQPSSFNPIQKTVIL
jgi:hypothetical protein